MSTNGSVRHRSRSFLCAIAYAGALTAAPRVVFAHVGRAPAPHDLWHSWTDAPFLAIALLATAAWYAVGTRRVWRRAGIGRGVRQSSALAFGAAIVTLAIALLSPVDAISESLFSVHMTQHLLLVAVAAPLLVLGNPVVALTWAFPQQRRRTLARWWVRQRTLHALGHFLVRPVVAWPAHVITMWMWHTPRFYDAALADQRIHVAEHTLFLLTALMFWWPVLARRRMPAGLATLYLFAAALQGTLLGALITLARHPWYASHYATTAAWGLTPLEDQQVAGLLMWIPAGLIYIAAMIPGLVKVLRSRPSTRRAPDTFRYGTSGTP